MKSISGQTACCRSKGPHKALSPAASEMHIKNADFLVLVEFATEKPAPRGGLNSIHVSLSGEPCGSTGYVVRQSSCYSPELSLLTLPKRRLSRKGGRPRLDYRRVLDGVLPGICRPTRRR